MLHMQSITAKGRTRQEILQDAESGTSLIEVMVSVTVVVMSLLGLCSVIVSSHAMQVSTTEQVAAHNAIVDALERLRSTDLNSAYDQYRAPS